VSIKTEEDMLKMKLAASLAATALMAGAAMAQTSAPTQPAGAGQIMTQMPQDLMRGSRLMGVDVYGADNQKIGDIDEVLVDRQGKIHGLVVGVGGFLGIGQKDVAIPFDQVQWMSNQEVQASSNVNQGASGTNTAGGVTVPGTATGNQPATTGSTAAGTTGSPGAAGTMGGAGTAGTTAAGGGNNDNMPARAMVKMTKADLQNAPEFRYSNDANSGTSGAASTTAPAGAARPSNAPQQ
jgi:sporulation protein YlmC with PRC-barrel domain